MSVIVILCPKTGQQVSTGIEIDSVAFDAMPLTTRIVDCWACGGRHSWSRRWATLVEDDRLEFVRAGMPIPKPAPLTVR